MFISSFTIKSCSCCKQIRWLAMPRVGLSKKRSLARQAQGAMAASVECSIWPYTLSRT